MALAGLARRMAPAKNVSGIPTAVDSASVNTSGAPARHVPAVDKVGCWVRWGACLVPSAARTWPWHNTTYQRLQQSALDSWHRSVSGWRLSAPVGGWFDCDRHRAQSGPPEAVQDGGCRRRRLLAQRRACCPGLPRGLVRVPATRAPPSAAPAPRAIELAVGRGLKSGAHPTSTPATPRDAGEGVLSSEPRR